MKEKVEQAIIKKYIDITPAEIKLNTTIILAQFMTCKARQKPYYKFTHI